MTQLAKNEIKQELRKLLEGQKEIERIMVFGSFLSSEDPQDLDVAIFQNSNLDYLTLAMKYRMLTRQLSEKLPLDIIPIRKNASGSAFLAEIEAGELIYER